MTLESVVCSHPDSMARFMYRSQNAPTSASEVPANRWRPVQPLMLPCRAVVAMVKGKTREPLQLLWQTLGLLRRYVTTIVE